MAWRLQIQVQHQIGNGVLSMRHVMQRFWDAIKDALSAFASSVVRIRGIVLQHVVVLLDEWIQATLNRLHLSNNLTERLRACRLLARRRWRSSSTRCLSKSNGRRVWWSRWLRWWWRVVGHVWRKLDCNWWRRWRGVGGWSHSAGKSSNHLNSWARIVLLNGDVVDTVLTKGRRDGALKCLHNVLHILLGKISVGYCWNPDLKDCRLHRLLGQQIHVLIIQSVLRVLEISGNVISASEHVACDRDAVSAERRWRIQRGSRMRGPNNVSADWNREASHHHVLEVGQVTHMNLARHETRTEVVWGVVRWGSRRWRCTLHQMKTLSIDI